MHPVQPLTSNAHLKSALWPAMGFSRIFALLDIYTCQKSYFIWTQTEKGEKNTKAL